MFATAIFLDFETITPKGKHPSPIEVASLRFKLDRTTPLAGQMPDRFESFIALPMDGFLTPFDRLQTGITDAHLRDAPVALHVMKQLEATLQESESPVIVAQNASYERNIVRQFVEECPALAGLKYCDVVALAKTELPELGKYSLDVVRSALRLREVSDRHRAMSDLELTWRVVDSLYERWATRTDGSMSEFLESGLLSEPLPKAEQASLF